MSSVRLGQQSGGEVGLCSRVAWVRADRCTDGGHEASRIRSISIAGAGQGCLHERTTIVSTGIHRAQVLVLRTIQPSGPLQVWRISRGFVIVSA